MSKNKSALNWTFCQSLMEKPNCTKIFIKSEDSSLLFLSHPMVEEGVIRLVIPDVIKK
jgi:hypothetical protein